MEFGTGHDVRPGDDIALETSSGTQSLGEATYDSDHDGVGDSVIVIDDDHEYLITDADHDGYADSIRAFDSTGHEVDPRTGDPVDGADGSGSTGGSDSTDGSDSGAGSNSAAGADGTGGSDSSVGTDDGGAENGSAAAGTSNTGHGLIVAGDDGIPQDLGEAVVDLDRDGTPDTAVVREDDGAVTGYTDRDGDGTADQITRIGAAGDVVIAVSDGRGGWEVAATGHLDAAGVLVEDPVPVESAALPTV